MAISRWWIVVGFVSFVASGGSRSEPGQIKQYCDIPGHNISSKKTVNQHACRSECLRSTKCKAFTYVSGWGKCFLKSRAAKQHRVRFFAGHFDDQRRLVESSDDRDYNGTDLKKVSGVDSGKQCQNVCKEENKCKAFVYIEGYRDCWLKSSVGKSMKKIFYCGVKPAAEK